MASGYLVADDESINEFEERVRREFEIQAEPARDDSVTFFDTFDWRLYDKGFTAYLSGGSFVVTESMSDPPRFERESGVERFYREYEEGPLRDFIENVAGVRALLPVAEVPLREKRLLARNSDGKIVCRLSFLEGLTGGDEKRSYLLIRPLRGYTEEESRVRSMARKSGMDFSEASLAEELMRTQGVTPGWYRSKPDLRLDPDMTISEAVVRIDRVLLDTIRANIPGIIDDLDIEFVHDFRVATRRTRACLSQFKKALPPDRSREFAGELKAMARRCNVLRDLDVYLLERQRYYDLVPVSLHPGLDQYFGYVRSKRNKHQKAFSEYLETGAADSLLDEWEAFLDDPASLVDSRPAIDVAAEKILDRFQKIIKKGGKITDDSPDERLHRLRIDCKKLRYMLEFFQSFYPLKKMKALIRHLKEFQDNLGEFNDLVMQQKDLEAYLSRSAEAPQARLRTAAIGGLLTALNNRQVEVRRDFYERFEDFDSKENRSMYHELFGKGR